MTFDRSRDALDKHSVDMRQFADFREGTVRGMRVVDVYNGSGLTLSLLPDRGLDIWTAQYNGMPLTWIAAGSPFRPDAGSPWLRQFNGGLLTTCGLQHSGPSEVDDETGEERDVHGHFTRLSAEILRREGRWDGDRYVMELQARVDQSRLFGEQIRLERTYRLVLGEPAIEWVDVVENRSDSPAPFMLLYHINVGYPLVREGARFDVAASESYPRDAEAEKGFDAWPDYSGAVAGYAEQVFYHHVLADDDGASAVLSNGELGLMVSWDPTHAPYLSQWKNVREGIYVSGIEPANCVPEGQNAARASGRLVTLAPAEVQTFRQKVTVLDGEEALASAERRLANLRTTGRSVRGFRWRPPSG